MRQKDIERDRCRDRHIKGDRGRWKLVSVSCTLPPAVLREEENKEEQENKEEEPELIFPTERQK